MERTENLMIEARALVMKFVHEVSYKFVNQISMPQAKECAYIVIDGKIDELETCNKFYDNSYYDLRINYLKELKQEIKEI